MISDTLSPAAVVLMVFAAATVAPAVGRIAGVFLLAIMHPILGGTPLWHNVLLGIGALTMTWAALVAIVQTDLKRLLAYTTISALGTLVMLLGIESASATKAAVITCCCWRFIQPASDTRMSLIASIGTLSQRPV